MHLLKVAEGGVALDVVLLLEAVKVARMHVHPGKHLEGRVKGRESRRDSEARQHATAAAALALVLLRRGSELKSARCGR